MTTPEGAVKDQVRRILKQYNVHWHMPVPTGFGKTHLDFICCAYGYYLAIETKTKGERPTAQQDETIRQIQQTGGVVLVINEHNVKDLIEWLDWRRPWSRRAPTRALVDSYEPQPLKTLAPPA